MNRVRALLACVVLATGAGAGAPARADADHPLAFGRDTPVADRQRGLERLVAAMEEDGRVGVIVGLRTPTVAPRDRDDPSAPGAGAIRAIEDAVIGRLTGDAGPVRRLAAVPAITLRAGPDTLRRLASDPAVISLERDVSLKVALKDSTRIIRATRLWALHDVTGEKQIVAVLDTGVDPTHPMLTDKIVDEACFSTRSPRLRPLCPNGSTEQTGGGAGVNCPASLVNCEHGTLVATIAAGARHAGASGVAPAARIMAVQVASLRTAAAPGGCNPVPCAEIAAGDLLAGLDRVWRRRHGFAASGARIAAVNVSLASEQWAVPCDGRAPVFADMVERLRKAGIATVTATGNDQFDGFVGFPSCLSGALSVAATTKDDALWPFSNIASLTKLLAPGAAIRAGVPRGSACAPHGGRYCTEDGTSLAAPHVAGAVALMRSARPAASVDDVLAALNCSGRLVQGISAFHHADAFHRPRIDVLGAWAALTDPPGDETFRFSAGIGRWHAVLGDWTVAGGALRSTTRSWPTASPFGVIRLDYCATRFKVVARIRQIDPLNPKNAPLETGILVASNLSTFLAETRASGMAFLLRASGRDGEWVVKRFDDKLLSAGTLSDETTLCSGVIPDLSPTVYHRLAVVVGAFHTFFVDGRLVCAISPEKDLPRHAPPAAIALVARRVVSGDYRVEVDQVDILAP